MRGRVARLGGDALREITWDGMDGHGYLKIGKRAALSQLSTMRDLDSAAAAKTHVTNCVNLKGTLVTVTYADGQTALNVAIIEVLPQRVTLVKSAVGGLGTAVDRYISFVNFQVRQAS